MPELPDVESLRRYLDATSLHQTIRQVDVDAARELSGISAARLRERLEGRSLVETRRHGKHLFARLDGDGWLRLHFGMTGWLQYLEDGERPPYTRLMLHFPRGRGLAFACRRRLGRIGMVDDPGSFVADQGLGPDALDPAVTQSAFRQLLAGRRGTVKSALMNQRLLAGLGNIYTDEALFQAGIDPRTEPGDLDMSAVDRLYRAMRHVLKVAIDHEADPSRLPRSWLLPYRRAGVGCPRCGGTVERITMAGRSTYFCSRCQPRNGSG